MNVDMKLNEISSPKQQQQDKRPPSSLSTGSTDSGVFSSGVIVSSSQPTEPSSAIQTGPPSPTSQINSLLYQTANLIAVNEQLRKEIAENHRHIINYSQQQQHHGSSDHNTSGDTMSSPASPGIENVMLQPPPPPSQQHQQQQQQRMRGGVDRRMQKPESYKTVICQAWLESKTCSFAENCRFAHGEEELRPSKVEPRQNNKYKTKLCDKYTTTGLCPYGKRCLFIHPDHGPNAYIRADKLFEVSQRHALADLRDRMETQILNGRGGMFSTSPEAAAVAAAVAGAATVPPPAPPPSASSQSAQMPPPLMGHRPSTPIENMKPPGVPLGPTPVSMRGPRFLVPRSNNNNVTSSSSSSSIGGPHPSWPLEPSSFFNGEIGGPTAAAAAKLMSRPVSPFESMLIGAAVNGTLPYATMLGSSQTPGGVSGYVSGGSTPYQEIDNSPFLLSTGGSTSSMARLQHCGGEEDSFSMVPGGGFDHLAEDMAKHLELW